MKVRNLIIPAALLFGLFICAQPSAHAQSASVQDVWLDRNVNYSGVPCMAIHTHLIFHNLLYNECKVIAYFYDEYGNQVRGDSYNYPGYVTTQGQAAVQRSITPDYVDCEARDFVIYMPREAINPSYSTKNYYVNVEIFCRGYNLASYGRVSSRNAFSMSSRDYWAYAPQTSSSSSNAYSNSYSGSSSNSYNSSSSSSSSGSNVGATLGAIALGAAAIYGIAKWIGGDSSSSSSSSSSSASSSYTPSRGSGYYTKKYSAEDVARIIASNRLYAVRFVDGSNLKQVDMVTEARVVNRGGTQYMSLPNYLYGEYKLQHGHSYVWNGGMIYINEDGDNWYLMDSDKNVILY